MDYILSMDSDTLDVLHENFEDHGGEVTLEQFVTIMLRQLPSESYDTDEKAIELVKNLTTLFEDCDIDGNGSLEWEELSVYFGAIGEIPADQLPQPRLSFRENPDFSTNTLHRLCIKKMVYIPEVFKLVRRKLKMLYMQRKEKIKLFTVLCDGRLSSNAHPTVQGYSIQLYLT